jgi:hypothetical protein
VSLARHGWILQWFVKDGEGFVDRADIADVTVDQLEDVFEEPSADNMMCLSYRMGPDRIEALRHHVGCAIDLTSFDSFVSGWSERGFRNPPEPPTLH